MFVFSFTNYTAYDLKDTPPTYKKEKISDKSLHFHQSMFFSDLEVKLLLFVGKNVN